MKTYLNRVAGILNATFFVFALVLSKNVNFDSMDLPQFLFLILMMVTPPFTLITLFAPDGR